MRAQSGEEVLPAILYVKVSLTALGYMRAPEAHFKGDKFKLLLVHSDNRSSKTFSTDVANAFRHQGRSRTIGKRVRVGTIATTQFTSAASLEEELREGGYNCVFLSTGLDSHLSEIVRVAEAQKVLSLACRSSYVKHGVALGVVQIAKRPRIYINSTAAKTIGVRFKNQLLSRVTVVDR